VPYMRWFVALALASFYLFALILDRAAGVLFFLLVLSGLIVIASRAAVPGQSFWQLSKAYWPINLAMAAPFIAVFANQVSMGRFSGRNIDSPLRLALFALVFWAVMLVPYRRLKLLQWAFVVGAFFSTIKMYVLTAGGSARYSTDFIPLIVFAELAILLGLFSVFSIRWHSRGGYAAIVFKLLAACAAVYGAYMSQSRGAWMTIPIFGVIAYISAKDLRRKHKMAVAAICIVVLGALLHFGNIVNQRIAAAETDIQEYAQGTNLDTSIGTRLQLWKGSWTLFKEHPLFGVGVEGYPVALHDLAARKIISPGAATFAHSHNEVLFMMARFGLFGLLAILAVYFVPAYYFGRDLRHNDKEIRGAAGMGLALCLGIAGLGLTDVVFLWWEIFPFYAVSTALFLACIIKRRQYLAESVSAQ
jgi:O-antigen ligase